MKEFLRKAREIHGERYSYKDVKYINSRTKVIITCHEHGNFRQRPEHHINRKSGCPICARVRKLNAIPVSTRVPKGKIAIPLSQGKIAVIDKESFDMISKHTWFYAQGSAAAWIDGKRVLMHKLLIPSKNLRIVHKDGNKLNNTMSNLAFAGTEIEEPKRIRIKNKQIKPLFLRTNSALTKATPEVRMNFLLGLSGSRNYNLAFTMKNYLP